MEPWHVDREATQQSCVSGAVRMVAEVRPDYPSDWPAICAVARKLDIGTTETRSIAASS